jgi:ribonucleoside-diphosphate reductase beta chain
MLLDPEINLTLRPMAYPQFFHMYRDSIRNFWTTDEIDFAQDYEHLKTRITPEEAHLIKRLVAFFATADNIVAHNLVLNLYKHVNSPEYRMFLGKQLFDEMVHVEAYLLLVDAYVPDMTERREAFDAYKQVPSVKLKADFALKYMDSIGHLDALDTDEKRQQFILNLMCFASCIEGLFFFGSFAYVYFLRSKGLLPGLATATNWIFRDESMHMQAAFEVIKSLREEYPQLFTPELENTVRQMLSDAINVEMQFCTDSLQFGITGLSPTLMRQYLEYCADQRFQQMGYTAQYRSTNPFSFMALQDVQSLTNFFERRVVEYQKGVGGSATDVSFDDSF